jgi:hypothetical protein
MLGVPAMTLTPAEIEAINAAIDAIPPLLTDEQIDAIVLTLCAIEERAKGAQ